MEPTHRKKNTMGLLVMVCACSGSTGLARKYMRNAGYEQWASHPVHEGKQHCVAVLDGMRREGYDTQGLQQWIISNSSFVVFVGYVEESKGLVWRDARAGSVESRIAAEGLIQAFA